MKKITIIAITAALAVAAGQLNADPISGTIDFAGFGATFDTTSRATDPQVTSWNGIFIGGGTGELAPYSGSVTAAQPWIFNNGALASFITFDGFTFDLNGSYVIAQGGSGPTAYVDVFGSGSLYGNGYSDTATTFSFSSTGSGSSVDSFQATLTAVPDGGTTVALLGGALTALGLVRRKMAV